MTADRELLAEMLHDQLAQLAYRRQRENEVFTWSSAILVGFVGAALLFTPENQIVLLQTKEGATLAAVLLALVTAFSVKWQLKQRESSPATSSSS